jgi:hypothetical protein
MLGLIRARGGIFYLSVLVVSTPFKLCSDIFTIYFLKGLLFNKPIADSSSCLVLYLLRKKGAKFGINGVKDYQNGNFDNTKSNIIERIIPKAIERITKVKKEISAPIMIKIPISVNINIKKNSSLIFLFTFFFTVL